MGRFAAVVVGLALWATSACLAGDQQTVRVFAAASLTDAFTVIAQNFEQDHPGVQVQLNFGPSSGLATQIEQGAPADVFATAAPQPMEQLGDVVSGVATFATNSLVLVTPTKNPGAVGQLSDLSGADLAVCQVEVPCGELARRVLDGLRVEPVTYEQDVRAVLTKVQLGEVDAGLVYRSDLTEGVREVPILPARDLDTEYPIARVNSSDSEYAQDFVRAVLSEQGQAVLAEQGFGTP